MFSGGIKRDQWREMGQPVSHQGPFFTPDNIRKQVS